MEHTSPQPDVQLPQELQLHIERVRDGLTLSEAELKRLNALRVSEEYQISELNKRKVELGEEIKALTEQKTSLEFDVNEKGSQLENSKGELEKVEIKRKEHSTFIDSELVTLEQEKGRINGKRSELISKEKELNAREADISSKEKAHQERVNKIAEAIKE